jgi:hypothetical protein
MPDKHFYFSIGAGIGSVLSYYLITTRSYLNSGLKWVRKINKRKPYWYLFFPILIVLIGLWGLVPDMIHALGLLSKESTRSPAFNIFFLHSYFEQLEDINLELDRQLNWLGELILLSVSLVTMNLYVKIIKRNIRKHKRKISKDKIVQN